MADAPSFVASLGRKLCPWLAPDLERLEAARAEGRLGHAWLIAGPSGIGKTNLALAMAHRLLDPRAPLPLPSLQADEAAAALRTRQTPGDHHPDLHWLVPEEDKRTISVDQVRAAGEALALTSLRGRAKVIVIEPAEAMTIAAANALLKTLEEPTPGTYLWLVSHRPERLPATIRSRCQTLAPARPSHALALEWLAPLGEGADNARLLELAGRAPLRALTLHDHGFINIDKKLSDQLEMISKDRADPIAVADEWQKKLDLELVLDWLIRRLQLAIRERFRPQGSNLVTDAGFDRLHNAWRVLTLGTLFGRLAAAERLLDRLGSGINAELALRVLLLGFRGDEPSHERRGRL